MLRKWWFYIVILIILAGLFVLYSLTRPVSAQQSGPQLSPDVQNLVNQIHATGCQAEEIASAQTIDQLRKENEQLKARIAQLDPSPKSGATKH